MLVDLTTLLRDARRRRYAVPAFDCTEDVLVRTILETAEAEQAPVVLMCLEVDLAGNGFAYLPGLIKLAADYHSIPVVLHLDHARDLKLIARALDAGFSSVMIDGSELSFDENVRLTKAAVELAHARGVSVEGELGHVGGSNLAATHCGDSTLTAPRDVTRFVEQTGVDALAVSIGTAHGIYQSLPDLDIPRLKQLTAASPVPLVLHGGSGTPDPQLQAAIEHGICKVNIYADVRVAMGRGLKLAAEMLRRQDPLPRDVFGPIRQEVAQVVAEKINLLGAAGRANMPLLDGRPRTLSVGDDGARPPSSSANPTNGKTFHHLGLLAPAEMPGETYYESLKVWATDPQQDPNRIEWLRFAPDSPLVGTPLARMPHISFAVDNLEKELGGQTPVVGPLQVATGVRIAYVMVDGALTEYLEVT